MYTRVAFMETPVIFWALPKKEIKNLRPGKGGGNEFIPEGTVWQSPVPTARPIQTRYKAGLPAVQLLFGLPGNVQWRAGKRRLFLVYGGGSAPAFHGIPY
jgi:hypothetical protein